MQEKIDNAQIQQKNYQRPADPIRSACFSGHSWWQRYTPAVDAFTNSAESKKLYGTIDKSNIAGEGYWHSSPQPHSGRRRSAIGWFQYWSVHFSV